MSTALVRQADRALVSRRGFLKRTAAAIVGLAAAKLLPAAQEFGWATDYVQQGVLRMGEFMRIDILFGWRVVRPDLVIRVMDTDDDADDAIEATVLRSELVEPKGGLVMRMVRS